MTFSAMTGCRDYISGIGDNEPPALYTDAASYRVTDSVKILLHNKSNSKLYVIGAYDYLEKKVNQEWVVYSHLSCPESCPEFFIAAKMTISNALFISNTGSYRFVCLYSFSAGLTPENKTKIYSNEFTVN